MRQVFIVNGTGQSGKDTFVDFCIERLMMNDIWAIKFSSVDKVKGAAALLGWDEVKDEKGRKFLSDLKDMSTKAYEGPMRYMLGEINSSFSDVIFIFIREPEEIQKIADIVQAKTVLVSRHDPRFCNHADQNVEKCSYDFYIDNTGSLEGLDLQANLFTNMIKEKSGK